MWHDGVVFIAPQPFSLQSEDLGKATIHIANLLTVGKETSKYPMANIKSHILCFKDMRDLEEISGAHWKVMQEGVVDLVKQFCEALSATGIFDQQAQLGVAPGYPPKFIGVDIIFDENLKPWLLEAERYPRCRWSLSRNKEHQ